MDMSILLLRLKKIIASRQFFICILCIFFIQSLWFASSIRFAIPPDERYHYGFTDYYAKQSIFSGPVLTHQTSASLYLGDLERTPNYLYQYLLSFPLRIVSLFTSSFQLKVFSLRFINILLGLSILIILRKIIKQAGQSDFVSNITLLTYSLTGMFVWISGSINYDNLSTLTFLVFLYYLLRFQKKPQLVFLMNAAVSAMLTVLIKATYIPPILATLIFYASLNIKQYNQILTRLKEQSKQILRPVRKSFSSIVTVVIILMLGLLLLERLGINAVKYHSLVPQCNAIHTLAECQQSSSDAQQLQRNVFEVAKKTGKAHTPKYTDAIASWGFLMYQRLYFYFGHKSIRASNSGKISAVMLIGYILSLLIITKKKLINTKEEKLLLLAAAAYILLLFYVNISSYLSLGREYGYQGRYLLPVLPFIYMMTFKLIIMVSKEYKGIRSTITLSTGAILVSLFVVCHFPLTVFVRGADASWYTAPTARMGARLRALL